MGKGQGYLLIALGALLLVSTVRAQDDNSHQNSEGQNEQQTDENQGQKDYNYDEMLSLVEFEFYEMDPTTFTLYGEEFVDSINSILRGQKVNSSVVGVLVNEQTDEKSTTVATLILSYVNDTILNQLGDIETYIAAYIYKNHNNFSLQAARVTSVHSRKVSSLSSDAEKNHKGWGFVAGTISDPDYESRSTETIATVRYNKIAFTLGHGHSFGYGVGKRSVTGGRKFPKEIAELDDDFFEWNRFKVFHMRDAESVSEGTNGWKTMTWSESSIQKSAQDAWSNNGKGYTGTGAITGTIVGVMLVAAAAVGVVGFVFYRRRKKNLKQKETPSPDRESTDVTDGINEQTALV